MLLLLLFQSSGWGQTPAESNKSIGVIFGTGFFQQTRLELTNFKQEIIATSDYLVPTNFKADFSYYLTPHFALRFSSGYAFARQVNKYFVDYSRLDSAEVKFSDKARFTMSGFPVETAMIFQMPVDADNTLFFHVGLGMGYYAYNYRTSGITKEASSVTDRVNWQEEYLVPDVTLSGWAQFILFGIHLHVSKNVGASFELSKVGLSYVKIKQDIARLDIYGREIQNQFIYGVRQQDYNAQTGFDDVALSLGIYWRL